MSKNKKTEEKIHYVFVKDHAKSKSGFATVEAAHAHAATIPQSDDIRVRTRYRTRNNSYDVVVKTRRDAATVGLVPQNEAND